MTDREHAWGYIKEHRRFSVSELVRKTPISRSNAQTVCRLLEKRDILDGHVEPGPTNALEKHYEVLRVPASDRPWDEDPDRVSWRQQVWNGLRLRPRFTVADLARGLSDDARVTRASVHRFVQALVHEGSVRRVGRTTSEAGGQPMLYEVTVRPGPTPPDMPSFSQLRRSGAL